MICLGSDASVAVKVDTEDDGIVHVENRDIIKTFEMDKVFGPSSSQQEVRIVIPVCGTIVSY